jgi:hypothetical protein
LGSDTISRSASKKKTSERVVNKRYLQQSDTGAQTVSTVNEQENELMRSRFATEAQNGNV